MRLLSEVELSTTPIYGGNMLLGVIAGGAVNATIWAAWTAYIDNKPEKVTPKKFGLTFVLGAMAAYSGIYLA